MGARGWLPDGIEAWLPPVSWAAEDLRRRLLDHYRRRRYELIVPPLVEDLGTLLTGTGADLDLQTFKLVDPASGRMLGVRADMTPQAARIAAQHFAARPIVRLCYLGTVLRTKPNGPGGGRAPQQVGCELFGDERGAADLEILRLMTDTVELAGVGDLHLDLGHVGVYRGIVTGLKLDGDQEATLFDILQRKSRPDLEAFAKARRLRKGPREALAQLMDLHGGLPVLRKAEATLGQAGAGVRKALSELGRAARALRRRKASLPVHIDLAELRGYRYQTGLVFAAYVPGHGRELARGGRYDGIGRTFGAARPATGFSADLDELLRLGGTKKKRSRAKKAKRAK